MFRHIFLQRAAFQRCVRCIGQRVCIGNSFAMMEAQLLLSVIAQRWDLALLPGQSLAPAALITLGPKTPVQMSAHLRIPARESELPAEQATSLVLI